MSSPATISLVQREHDLRVAYMHGQRRHLDFFFAGFLIYEWVLAFAVTVWISRNADIPLTADMRHHYDLTLVFGAFLAVIPAICVALRPGRRLTRCVIAATQILFSGLLIHLTGFRIGVHFHICASLLFLLFYWDAWVMAVAAGAGIVDQIVRGLPGLSTYLFTPDSRWHTVEHAGWVIFGALFVLDARREAIGAFRRQAEREAELETDLEQARRSAGRDATDRTGLLAAAGRALRAPVESVLGMTSLLLDSVLNPTQERVTRAIQESGEFLRATVNDILNLYQVDSGQAQPDPVPCDLPVVVSQAVDWLDQAARPKNLHLWVKYPPQCPRRFVADRARIRHVLLNLLSNAVRATEGGGITVAVEAIATFGDETTMRITVSDTGTGMSDAQLARINALFDPQNPQPAAGATGLGLPLSVRLVKMLGGEMGVSSKPGLGSQFWFTMRLKRDAREMPAHEGSGRSELADQRILVVDQVPANRQIMAEVLSQWGCRAECASAALVVERMGEAVRSGDPFRMVVAGQRMAEADAFAMARAVKADPQLRDTVLVMAAAHPTPQALRESLKAGFTEYIEKPSGLSSIYDGMVRAYLETRQEARAAATPEENVTPQEENDWSQTRCVLVVNDDAVERAALARAITEFGFRAETASSGSRALEMWGQGSFDVILMDSAMPGMDGYETVMEIRGLEQLGPRDPEHPRTPIVMLLESGPLLSRVKSAARGVDGSIAKPLSKAALRETIERQLPVGVFST